MNGTSIIGAVALQPVPGTSSLPQTSTTTVLAELLTAGLPPTLPGQFAGAGVETPMLPGGTTVANSLYLVLGSG